MSERSYFVAAALRYEELLDAGQWMSLDDFVAQEPAATRDELRAYLEFNLTLGDLDEPAALSADQEARANQVIALAQGAWMQELSGAPARNLVDLRRGRNLTVGRLARQLQLPVDLLARLERGKVLAASIPARVIERLADALHETVAAVQAALVKPPPVVALARLKAVDGMTEAEEPAVSFREAFAQSDASAAERAAWADVVA